MNFKKLESGRSMVEMLGVLAIIGVLSVGGIAGYSLSMRRHRANQVVDILSKYALVFYSNCQQRVLNGEATGSASSGTIMYYSNCDMEFEDAGVGSRPAGVNHVGTPQLEHNLTSGVDIVTVSAEFDDDKLCQAVASIAGTECVINGTKAVYIQIKQN